VKLDPIGKIDNLQDIDLDPITVPVCGIKPSPRPENVCEEFNFRPGVSWGNTFALVDAIETGEANLAWNAVKWLRNALIDEPEQKRFQAFLSRPDVLVEEATLTALVDALRETWAARPTMPQPSSNGTGTSTKRTSQAASRARASRSRNSRSPSRST
jgi:hypothetical protein